MSGIPIHDSDPEIHLGLQGRRVGDGEDEGDWKDEENKIITEYMKNVGEFYRKRKRLWRRGKGNARR